MSQGWGCHRCCCALTHLPPRQPLRIGSKILSLWSTTVYLQLQNKCYYKHHDVANHKILRGLFTSKPITEEFDNDTSCFSPPHALPVQSRVHRYRGASRHIARLLCFCTDPPHGECRNPLPHHHYPPSTDRPSATGEDWCYRAARWRDADPCAG